jgi:hypothetical protein
MDSDRWIDPVLIKPLGMVVVVVAIYADTERWLVVLNAVLDALSMSIENPFRSCCWD